MTATNPKARQLYGYSASLATSCRYEVPIFKMKKNFKKGSLLYQNWQNLCNNLCLQYSHSFNLGQKHN